MQEMKDAVDNGDIEKAVTLGLELILSGKNKEEGIKYLEYAANQNNPAAIYWILFMTDYKTDYFYEKLKQLAKVNEEAKEWLWCWENE